MERGSIEKDFLKGCWSTRGRHTIKSQDVNGWHPQFREAKDSSSEALVAPSSLIVVVQPGTVSLWCLHLLEKWSFELQIKHRLFLHWCSFSAGSNLPSGLRIFKRLGLWLEVEEDGVEELELNLGWAGWDWEVLEDMADEEPVEGLELELEIEVVRYLSLSLHSQYHKLRFIAWVLSVARVSGQPL